MRIFLSLFQVPLSQSVQQGLAFGKKFLFPLALLLSVEKMDASAESLIKKEICSLHDQLEKSVTKKETSEILFHLALAYEKDQEVDKAFFSFLEALKNLPISSEKLELDEALGKEALTYYFQEVTAHPIEGSKQLIEKYGSLGSTSQPLLKLVLAAAYANLGEYPFFFTHFYEAYPFVWDTFLSYKLQSTLCLRLGQREPQLQKKESLQKEAMAFLQKALEKKADPSLYKILIALAEEKGEEDMLFHSLQALITNKVIFPRSELFWYVQEAVSIEAYELAQELIDYAHLHYPVSKAVDAAQEYLNQFNNG